MKGAALMSDYITRSVSIFLGSGCLGLTDVLYYSAPYPETDESDVNNRDPFILHTYEGLPNIAFVPLDRGDL